MVGRVRTTRPPCGAISGSKFHVSDIQRPPSADPVVVLVVSVLNLVAAPSAMPLTKVVRTMVETGTFLPGVSLVGLVVYYGPGFLLVMLLFPRCAKAAATFGPGLTAFLSLGICMTMISESRIAAVYVPAFLAMVTLLLCEMRELARWGYYVTAALCVVFSKVWLPIAWSDSYSRPFTEFSEQVYFMNFGPFMSIQTFALQAAAVVVAALVLACWLFTRPLAVPSRPATP
jgi:hypothetical protein